MKVYIKVYNRGHINTNTPQLLNTVGRVLTNVRTFTMATSSIPRISGIYKITCLSNNRIYIGSSANIHQRWLRHLNDLRKSKHHNCHLQRAFDKYGEESFVIEILEIVMPFVLLDREDYWLKKLKPFGNNGFNLHLKADGSHLSTETIERMSKAKLGKPIHTPESRAEISARMMGNSNTKGMHFDFTTEHCEKISAGLKGKKKTSEHCANNAKAQAKYNYIVTDPNGNEIVVNNMRQFCRDNGLWQGNMAAVSRGEKNSYRGWKVKRI